MRTGSRLAVLVLLGTLGSGTPAFAEIYRWHDAEGRLHFTERLDKVPPEHRVAARDNATPSSEPAPPPTALEGEPAPAAMPSPSARSRARATRGQAVVEVPFVRAGTLMKVDVRLNDVVTAPFLVDTGASGVSLPSRVADRLGIRVTGETPVVRVTTAAGVVNRAMVTLDAVELAGARVENLTATVNPAMEIGLLGGTFFNNFVYQVDAAKSVILLKPNEGMRGGLGEEQWRARFDQLRDPLARLTAYLEGDEVQRDGERAHLERRLTVLVAELDALEDEANRLDVPYTWRH